MLQVESKLRGAKCSCFLSQVNAIESANMNKETLEAMKKGADVLKGIHGKL